MIRRASACLSPCACSRLVLHSALAVLCLAVPAPVAAHPGPFHEHRGADAAVRNGGRAVTRSILPLRRGTRRPAGSSPTLQVLRAVGGYEVLAVDRGVAYAVYAVVGNTARTQLHRSADEGASWVPAGTLPAQIATVSVLRSGTLLAATRSPLATQGQIIWRSTDQGTTWRQVSFQDPFDPNVYDTWLPGVPYVFQTLTAHSIADDGAYAYLGTYNLSTALFGNTNYVYRSADDGRSWQIASRSADHRHIHSLRVGPDGRLYAAIGDDGGHDGVFVSTDRGLSFRPLCSGRSDALCILVNMDFDPSGNAVYDLDHPYGDNEIVRLDVAFGQPTVLASVPYESFSAERLPDGRVLVGTAYEPAGGLKAGDPNLRLYAVVGNAVYSVYSTPIGDPARWGFLSVAGVYANGDAALYQSGFGTVFVRLAGTGVADPPPTPSAPALPSTTPSANLAPDADFEADPSGTYYTNGAATFAWAADRARTGARSLKIVSSGAGLARWMTVTSAIRAQAGRAYVASAWLQPTDAPGGAVVALDFWDASGAYLGTTESSDPVAGTQGWTQAAVQALAPPGTVYVRLELRLYGGGTLWVDDVRLSARD
jgi:hypothetical protein